MSKGLVFAGGLVLGAVLVMRLAPNTSSCCKRVASGVRSTVTGMVAGGGCGKAPSGLRQGLADVLGTVGDATGLWDYGPGILDAAGVT